MDYPASRIAGAYGDIRLFGQPDGRLAVIKDEARRAPWLWGQVAGAGQQGYKEIDLGHDARQESHPEEA